MFPNEEGEFVTPMCLTVYCYSFFVSSSSLHHRHLKITGTHTSLLRLKSAILRWPLSLTTSVHIFNYYIFFLETTVITVCFSPDFLHGLLRVSQRTNFLVLWIMTYKQYAVHGSDIYNALGDIPSERKCLIAFLLMICEELLPDLLVQLYVISCGIYAVETKKITWNDHGKRCLYSS